MAATGAPVCHAATPLRDVTLCGVSVAMDSLPAVHPNCPAYCFCRAKPPTRAPRCRLIKPESLWKPLLPSGELVCASYRRSRGRRSGTEGVSDGGVFDNVDEAVEEERRPRNERALRSRRSKARRGLNPPSSDSDGWGGKPSAARQEKSFDAGGWGFDAREAAEDDWGRDGGAYGGKVEGADVSGRGEREGAWGRGGAAIGGSREPEGRFGDGVRNPGEFAEARRWGSTSAAKSSRISMLRGDEKGRLLGLIPTGPQADYYAPKEASENVAWWGGTIGVVILLSKFPLLAAFATGSPFFGPWALAGLRNYELVSKGSTFAGIWHAEIMDSELLDLRPESFGSNPPQKTTDGQSVRLVIGDPWKGGVRVEIVVPYTTSFGPLDPSTAVELLVLSDDKQFSTFKVVREVFLPETRSWLSDYPFIDRDVFVRLSYQISRQAPRDTEKWSW